MCFFYRACGLYKTIRNMSTKGNKLAVKFSNLSYIVDSFHIKGILFLFLPYTSIYYFHYIYIFEIQSNNVFNYICNFKNHFNCKNLAAAK